MDIQTMSTQEIYDAVCDHLRAQGKRSVNKNDDCMYRGPNGMKCAIGIFIPDTHYTETMENKTVFTLAPVLHISPDKIDFLEALQAAHDHSYTVDSLNARLVNIAHIYHLTPCASITRWEDTVLSQ